MPLGRFPDRVKAFRQWAQSKTDNAVLSDSATPSNGRSASSVRRMKKRRKKRRNRRKRRDG